MRFDFRDEGGVYHSDTVTTGSEYDKSTAVGSKMSEVSRRDFARPSVGKAQAEGPERTGLEVFFDGFFGHGLLFLPAKGRSSFGATEREFICQLRFCKARAPAPRENPSPSWFNLITGTGRAKIENGPAHLCHVHLDPKPD